MAYATYSDLTQVIPEETIIQLTDDELTDAARTDRVIRAIERACALIDSYIGRRYTIPLVTVPPLVRDIAVDLAIYYIYQRSLDDQVAESIRNRYTDSVAQLDRIASGKTLLDVTVIETESRQTIFATNKRPCDTLFTDDLLSRL